MAGALTSCSLPVFRPLRRRAKTTKRFRVSAEIQEPPSLSVKEEAKSSPSISLPKDFKPPDPKPFTVPPGKTGDVAGAALSLFFRFGSGVFAQGYSVSRIPEDQFPPGQYAASASGYKLQETAKLGPRPEKPIEIYEFQSCPFCRKVREIVSILDIDVLFYPCPRNGPNFRAKVLQMGGKQQFPYMVDPNTGVAMYESDDIIKYLVEKYGDGTVPLSLSLGLLTTLTAGLAMIGRMGKGSSYTPSKLPPEPLEVWAYEGSPFCILVREVLIELELPHIQRSYMHGRDCPIMQFIALMVLNLTSSSFGCERNRSIFERIHTKKRNRLLSNRSMDFVYIRFTAKLKSKKMRQEKTHGSPMIAAKARTSLLNVVNSMMMKTLPQDHGSLGGW